jgi:hypothetical protein
MQTLKAKKVKATILPPPAKGQSGFLRPAKVFQRAAETPAPQKFVPWHEMSETMLIAKAQDIIDKKGFKDWESFSKTYKAIRLEFTRRGLEPNDLQFCKRSRPTRPWREMSNSEVLAKAQETIDRNGFPDWEAFAAVYRGIRFELLKRNLSRDELDFRQ